MVSCKAFWETVVGSTDHSRCPSRTGDVRTEQLAARRIKLCIIQWGGDLGVLENPCWQKSLCSDWIEVFCPFMALSYLQAPLSVSPAFEVTQQLHF